MVVLGTDDLAELALGLVFCALLVTVTLTDLERRMIPNAILAAGARRRGSRSSPPPTPPACPSARSPPPARAASCSLAALAYPRGMGMGDVKLAAVMGLFLGKAVVAGDVRRPHRRRRWSASRLLARHGAGARKHAVPFGPFLALGGVVGLLAGDEILDWYLDSFVR